MTSDEAPPVDVFVFSRTSSCRCTFVIFACTVIIAIPLCINYSAGGVYWDIILVAVMGCLFWSALFVAMYLRTRDTCDDTEE